MIGVLHCLLLGIIIAQPATPLSRQDFITLRDTGHSPRKTGALKTLTVLVKHPKAEPHRTREEMERVIYQDLNAYVKSSSYGQAHLEGKVIGWYSIPELNLSGFNLFNKKIDPKGVHEFIKQVLDHAQDHEDVSKYDHLILVMGTRGRPYGFNGRFFFIVAATYLPAGAEQVTAKSPEEIRQAVEGLKKQDVAWREVRWKTCLLDGLDESRRTGKPLMLWVFIDRPIDDERC